MVNTAPSSPNHVSLASRIGGLDDRSAVRILHAIAQPKLRAAGSEPVWTPDLGRALCAEFDVPAASVAAEPGELARQTLMLLAEDPANAEPIAALVSGPAPERFDLGAVSGTLLITAVLFALQSHIEFERDKQGHWSFKFKKTPTKDSIITPLIRRLVSLISGGPP